MFGYVVDGGGDNYGDHENCHVWDAEDVRQRMERIHNQMIAEPPGWRWRERERETTR